MLGIMIDCSRNAVMKVDELKRYTDYISKMGYDTLMLYTEDTFEVENEKGFGYMRGRYTQDELRELCEYCNSRGVELVPCIQTLAHLNCMFKWDEYAEINDIDDVLLIGNDRTYELIENIFLTISKCFTSKKVHIGMDEAYKVGLGKYLAKHGFEKRFDIINRHLHRVCEIADKYGLEPMLWGDMFIKLALDTEDYYSDVNADEISRLAALPQNVSLVYWDYYSTDKNRYIKMIENSKLFKRPVIFAGGLWTWKGFTPDNKYSYEIADAAIAGCNTCGVEDKFFCLWGDDGAECSKYAIMPAMLYAAELSKGNNDLDSIKSKFKQITKMNFDDFALLDKANRPDGQQSYDSAAKYLLYNDPFMGMFDYTVSGYENKYYADLRDELDKVEVTEEYKAVFGYIRELCDVLSVKSELGVKTRSLYKLGDKAALAEFANESYSEAIAKLKSFYTVFSEMWLSENKSFGFDIQEIRIGGLLFRLECCQKRIIGYCEGKIDNIPELEEELEEHSANPKIWSRIVTPNVVSHIL